VVGVGELGRTGGGGFVGGSGRVVGGDIVSRLDVVEVEGCVASDVVGEEAGVWVSCDDADGEVACVGGDVTGAFGLQLSSIANIIITATIAILFMIASG
jgi:hypothetical protein